MQAVEPSSPEVSHAAYLLEKIRIMETRRNYFGNIFWRMPGFTVAIVVLFVGVAHQGQKGIEWWAFILAGAALVLLGQIAWRIKECQDECERDLEILEGDLSELCHFHIKHPLRPSRRFGARFRLVFVFWLSGVISLAIGLWMRF